MEDLYEILEVPRDATQADIKKAYRKLVHQYHPDSHPGDKTVEEKFKKINAAYAVLNDPDKRARYDQFGMTGSNSGGNPFGGMGGVNLNDLFGDLGDMFSQAFGGGFAGGYQQRSNPNAAHKGDDIEMLVNISLLDAYKGLTRDVDVMKYENCQHCNGTGAKPGTKPETCPRCKGQGQVRQTQQSLFGQFVSITTCPECKGSGKIIRDKCDECGGRGQIRKKHTIEVKIPAGIERGMRLRIPGAGEDGHNGGDPGDLYLVVDVAPDKNFEREGQDLHTRLFITYPQAVLGSELEIKTLDGEKAKISVPAGTSHGQVLKVKGKGMPKLNNRLNSNGDLYAHVFIDVPTKLTDKQKDLIKQLAEEMKAPVGDGEPGFFDRVKNLFK